MKNIFSNIISKLAVVSASLLFGLSAFAQDGTVHYDKRVTEKPDENGVYTISLEAYVTGSVTVTTQTYPADIVLVLDYSSSMYEELDDLRNAVTTFVNTVQQSNSNVIPDKNGGHRVAIELFAANVFPEGQTVHYNRYTNYNAGQRPEPAHDVTYSQYLNQLLPVNTISDNLADMIGCTYETGTNSPAAMEKARDILAARAAAGDYTDDAQYDNSNRSRVVVFFTDGEPYIGSEDRRPAMNSTIEAAWDIKKPSSAYRGKVYSVGLFHNIADGASNQTTTYMSYVSSDYEDNLVTIPQRNPSYVPVSGEYSIIVRNASALANVFSSISSSAGGDYSASSASSVMIDVVATSFEIPTDANLGEVQVWRVPAVKPSKDAILTFNESAAEQLNVVADTAALNAITDPVIRSKTVCLTTDTKTGEVNVTGFDYGAEWCGYDEENNVSHGHKLMLTIPITVKDDAVGGPHVNTNTTDSKLIIKDSEGNVISENVFPRPWVKVPVSIWIQKTGLLEDDSAVFNLRRTPYRGPDVDYNEAEYDRDWGEKIVCNIHTMDENGCVRVSGLSPDYVYKIYEDAWGSLGYIYQDDDVLYTVGDNVQNPFKFHNTPREVKFDEAVVRNVFKKKEAAPSE